MSTSTLSAPAAARPGPSGSRPRASLWRRWLVVVTAGEAAGFLVPVLAVLAGAADLPGASGPAVLLAAGAAEGALLGTAQATVLAREVAGFSRRDWILRTAGAAVVAWAIGTAPSTWAAGVLDWPVVAQVALAVPAAAVLLASIGWAQWTVLRRHVPRAGRWIAWTATAWLAGLAVFTALTTPLWQPGQAPALVAAIGAAGGLAMALTMAAVTGRGAVRLLGGLTHVAVPGPDDGAGPAPWTLPVAEVAVRAGTDLATGLDDAEAATRLLADGPNAVSTDPPVSLLRSVLGQLRDTLVLVLLAAAVLTTATGDLVDTAVIGLVVVVNTTLGVVQERRALRAVAALSDLVAPSARVVRGGRDVWVPTRDLVRGDVLRLTAGDVVGADARLLSGTGLQVDESPLTGESLPVHRDADTISPAGAPLAERSGMVHAGTTVVRGTGVAVVVGTGAASAVGRVAALVERRSPMTPLQRRLARLGRQIALAVAVAGVLFVASGLLRGQPWETTVVAAVALAVAAVPESLPAVVTLALAGGAARMSRRGAVVRSLPAVETLGSVTLLATDKTGTLTAGAMVAERAWTPADGAVRLTDPDVPPSVRALLEAAVLCNDADPSGGGAAGAAGTADTETSLVRAAAAVGIDVAAVRAAWPRTAEEPFDAVTRRMTTVHRAPGAGTSTVTKGAPEAVLPGLPGAGPAEEVAAAWAADGARLLAVARDGVPLGLVALADPIRPEAAAAIASCHRAGIRLVLVTGDHAGTAEAVARSVGLVDDDHPVETSVLARVEPEGKLRYVTARQAEGQVVAMTGDGVNDAPALRAADIGVAMGQRGTEVAKQAADLVLADDSLATVTAAVAEGRRVYDNVRRFVGYGLAGGLAEVLVMLLGPFLGLGLPLLPAQILWVNLLTHGPVGVAMGSEPAAPDVLDRAPRRPSAGVVDRAMTTQVLAVGAAMAVACLLVALVARAEDGAWQTQLFVTLTAGQLAVALALRPPGAWAAGRGGSALPLAVAGSAALLAAAVYAPPLQQLLGTRALGVPELTAALVGALLPVFAVLWVRWGQGGHRTTVSTTSRG
ncbi:cation-translocating P-type ATPase [Geodermatophilus sp. FMUSA9-8]|uniref:cation-translocating P-type ATPase n=1 Tax=Geodermatophilus sp. FMUSA9-8 TaxID=3120155 RepID=UPI00300853CB